MRGDRSQSVSDERLHGCAARPVPASAAGCAHAGFGPLARTSACSRRRCRWIADPLRRSAPGAAALRWASLVAQDERIPGEGSWQQRRHEQEAGRLAPQACTVHHDHVAGEASLFGQAVDLGAAAIKQLVHMIHAGSTEHVLCDVDGADDRALCGVVGGEKNAFHGGSSESPQAMPGRARSPRGWEGARRSARLKGLNPQLDTPGGVYAGQSRSPIRRRPHAKRRIRAFAPAAGPFARPMPAVLRFWLASVACRTRPLGMTKTD